MCRGLCEICGEPISLEDPFYEMPYGELVCDDESCVEEWLSRHYRLGEVDLGWDYEQKK